MLMSPSSTPDRTNRTKQAGGRTTKISSRPVTRRLPSRTGALGEYTLSALTSRMAEFCDVPLNRGMNCVLSQPLPGTVASVTTLAARSYGTRSWLLVLPTAAQRASKSRSAAAVRSSGTASMLMVAISALRANVGLGRSQIVLGWRPPPASLRNPSSASLWVSRWNFGDVIPYSAARRSWLMAISPL